jgi:hypothetical protein
MCVDIEYLMHILKWKCYVFSGLDFKPPHKNRTTPHISRTAPHANQHKLKDTLAYHGESHSNRNKSPQKNNNGGNIGKGRVGVAIHTLQQI